jgi:hypothetical protein
LKETAILYIHTYARAFMLMTYLSVVKKLEARIAPTVVVYKRIICIITYYSHGVDERNNVLVCACISANISVHPKTGPRTLVFRLFPVRALKRYDPLTKGSLQLVHLLHSLSKRHVYVVVARLVAAGGRL